MAALNRASLLAIGVVAVLGMFPQTARQDFMLDEIASGKTRVLDLSYAINDKLVRWPGDEKVFEAKVNASVEKNGYFTRSFWMLEHYGTHLDASAFWACGRAGREGRRRERCGLSASCGARGRVGEAPWTNC